MMYASMICLLLLICRLISQSYWRINMIDGTHYIIDKYVLMCFHMFSFNGSSDHFTLKHILEIYVEAHLSLDQVASIQTIAGENSDFCIIIKHNNMKYTKHKCINTSASVFERLHLRSHPPLRHRGYGCLRWVMLVDHREHDIHCRISRAWPF